MPDPSDVDRNSGSSSDSGSDPGAAVATIDPAASDRIE